MALVVEAFLSVSFEKVIDKIVSSVQNFFGSKDDDPSILNKIKTTLMTLRAVLDDAEEKQIANLQVQKWLHDLKDAVYHADDLLDEVNTKALTRQIEAQSQSFGDNVRDFFSPSKRLRGGMNSELKEILERLEYFAKQKDILGLKEGISVSVWQRTPPTSVLAHSTIYGRDYDTNKLKRYLFSEDGCNDGVGVITIVGMGGLGKTTLAQLLYNDKEVQERFNLKGWALFSKEFDVVRVTKTLLESVSSEPILTNNLNTLQVQLQQRLSGKKFLFVLDDLWDTYNDWNRLKAILKSGDAGSRVIVTTRQENVAFAMNTFPVHYLSPLSPDQCWELFAEHAFGSKKSGRDQKLEVIGRKIADKCEGLPLAAETLGGLLRTKLSEKDWNKVLKSNIWDLPDNKVVPSLLLSYHYLPAPLKGCFAYCSIFPKNYMLDRQMVVRLWMAEGLVHPLESTKSVEEIADEYFDELVSRSLIQRRGIFKMHDLINDLATSVSAGYCYRYEDPNPSEGFYRVRHLSYKREKYDYHGKFDAISRIKGLRTFIALPLSPAEKGRDSYCYLAKRVAQEILLKMKYLRALSFSQYINITELPDLGNLIHLRYLDLSATRIKRLPNGTCKLYNLETLLLLYCRYLEELPGDIDKLINLRHVDIRGTKLKEMPPNMSKLKNLKTLTSFVVSKREDGLKVRELGNFSQLQGELSILNLQHVDDVNDAFHANMKNKEQIEKLAFIWGRDDTKDPRFDEEVLEQLQPSSSVKRLSIECYGGWSFPNWMGYSSFCNMVSVTISDCNRCCSLPPLGQLPALKQLEIQSLTMLKSIGVDFYGRGSSSFQPFPCLRFLYFRSLPNWEEWLSTGDLATEFPLLTKLSLFDCPKLRGNLPNNLPSLKTFTVDGCKVLELEKSNEVDNISTMSESPIPSIRSSHLNWISSLQSLQVHHSPGVLSLFETETLPFLRQFDIGSMNSLQLLPRVTVNGTHLQSLHVFDLPSLLSFQNEGLPTSLTFLFISASQKLEFLPFESLHKYSSLVRLTLFDSCHSLQSFPLGSLPVLRDLTVHNCPNLTFFSISDNSAQSLSHLKSLSVNKCPNLDFPQSLFPCFSLERFHVVKCEKLKSLPKQINTMNRLQELIVHDLPSLESFAEDGLPLNLGKLEMVDCGKLSSVCITQWGSRRLTSLVELAISGDDLVDTLLKKLLLPTSLVSLRITNVSYLDRKGLQHLTSLEKLEIWNCPRLELLPEKELLPRFLSVLTITRCPLLEDSYRSNGGTNWPKIAHIPCVRIHGKVTI